MGRVKFNVNSEYAYIQNFKILQSQCHVEAMPGPFLLLRRVGLPDCEVGSELT